MKLVSAVFVSMEHFEEYTAPCLDALDEEFRAVIITDDLYVDYLPIITKYSIAGNTVYMKTTEKCDYLHINETLTRYLLTEIKELSVTREAMPELLFIANGLGSEAAGAVYNVSQQFGGAVIYPAGKRSVSRIITPVLPSYDGLSQSEIVLLTHLCRHGPATADELRTVSGTKGNNVYKTIKNLIGRGFVVTSKDGVMDFRNRGHVFAATDKGFIAFQRTTMAL